MAHETESTTFCQYRIIPTCYYRNKDEVENIESVDALHIVTAVVTQVSVFITEFS